MVRFSLALLMTASLPAFACGAEQHETAREQETGREQGQRTPISEECPSDRPGPWTACPEADWVQRLAQRAGYRITGQTGSALIAEGSGQSFYIWAFAGTTKEVRKAAEREKWKPLGTVEGVDVYGDESLWRWWVVEGFVVWLQAGPYSDSQLPPLKEMGSLLLASKALPPPR